MFVSVHRSISLWGVWYLQRKSTPKNEYLRLKTLDFWRLSEDFESEEIGVTLKTWIFMRGLWNVKTFFRCSISSFLSHRKHHTVKGVEVKLRKSYQVMLISKSYTYQSFRVKPLEILHILVIFFSDRGEVLLVSEEFVLTKELEIRQCGLPTSEKHDSPEEFDS